MHRITRINIINHSFTHCCLCIGHVGCLSLIQSEFSCSSPERANRLVIKCFNPHWIYLLSAAMACLHPLRSLTIGQMLIPVEPFPGPLELQNHQTLTTVSLTVSLSLTVTHSLWGKGGWDGPESSGCVRSCCDCISLFAFGPSKMTFFFSKGKKKGKDMM